MQDVADQLWGVKQWYEGEEALTKACPLCATGRHAANIWIRQPHGNNRVYVFYRSSVKFLQ